MTGDRRPGSGAVELGPSGAFNRALLREIGLEVKQRWPEIDLRTHLVARNQGHWRFVVQGSYWRGAHFSWCGRAEDAQHAKYLAWMKFIETHSNQEDAA